MIFPYRSPCIPGESPHFFDGKTSGDPPSVIPSGYEMTENGWRCSEGFIGATAQAGKVLDLFLGKFMTQT